MQRLLEPFAGGVQGGQPRNRHSDDAAQRRPAAPAQSDSNASPSATILETRDAHSILGRKSRSPADEDMGRIVDVLFDGEGRGAP